MTMVLQIIDLLYIKYESQESIVMYTSNHWMERRRERGNVNITGRKWGMCYMYTPKNKPRLGKDILWHLKAQTENLITKYTAMTRKKDFAKRIKNK